MIRRHLIATFAACAAISFAGASFAADAAKPEPFPVKGKVTVVDFGATWCAGCPEMAERMKEMQKEYGTRAAFVVVDIDEYKDIEKKYMIEQMPSQMFYDAHGEPIWVHTGPLTKEELRERTDILIEGSAAPEDKVKPAAKK